MRRIIPCLILAAVVGCGNTDKYSEDSGMPTPPTMNESAPPQTAAGTVSSPVPTPIERQIIRNGSITLRVRSLDSAEQVLVRLASSSGGYIANASRQRSTGATLAGTTQLKVPSQKFDSVLAAVRRLGEMETEQIGSNDVTEEYVDLQARLKTQQELESRLLKLLAERTGKLADIVEIEEKLAQVRQQIESTQGRLRYLANQVAMATLTVTMFEPGAVGTSQTETFGGRVGQAFEQGIDGLVSLVGALITILIVLLPLALIVYGVYRLVRPILRRRSSSVSVRKKPESPGSGKDKGHSGQDVV